MLPTALNRTPKTQPPKLHPTPTPQPPQNPQNVVELLDDLFARAAAANEAPDRNYIRKHALSMQSGGVDLRGASSRLFSNPAGDYGSMVNERVGASNWDSGAELGDTWAARNAFSYGRGGERGVARPEVLQQLLGTCERVVQEVDSVEYGLTDIQVRVWGAVAFVSDRLGGGWLMVEGVGGWGMMLFSRFSFVSRAPVE